MNQIIVMNMIHDLTYVLFLHSQITYKILRTIIPLPSEQMLYKRYGTELKSEIENLLDSNQIKCILEEYRKELNSNEELFATIAYDSATVDPGQTNKSNLFVFNIQPFKGNIKSKIVHISLKEKGKTDESIKQLIHEIVEEGLKQGFHIVFVATDGETGTNDIHMNFGRFIDSLETDDFDEILKQISNYPNLIPVSDWLHLLKDLRTRFSNYTISMFPGSTIFNFRDLNSILKLDDLVFSAEGPSSMRDDLALHLFNSQNLSILAENGEFCAFSCLLPFTLVTISIQSTNLTSKARYLLIKIAYNILIELNDDSYGLRSRKGKKSPNTSVKFAENMAYRRVMNSIISLGYALMNFEENISLSRIFTHLVEYIFGYMRRLSYNKDESHVAVSALAKQQISQEIMRKYGLDSVYIRGRIDAAEDNINDLTSNWKLELCELQIDAISDEINQLMEGSLCFENTQTQKLLNFICENTPSLIPSLNTKKRKGDAILSRQIAYNKT